MDYRNFCKSLPVLGLVSSLLITGCSVNPATGQNQFTGLMSPQSEASIGASQHEAIVQEDGGLYGDTKLQNYVSSIGTKVAQNTERSDVTYHFYLLDSPVVNAFALPGGYIYVTRGLMAIANDEAELAGVLGHEIGHITGRHQAARYSQSVLTNLGTTLLGAAVGSDALTQALGVGSNLYISSYSREQELEADTLGVRYVSRAGYDPKAVSDFLAAMDQYQVQQSGNAKKPQADFFATHPQTSNRVPVAMGEAGKYAPNNNRNAETYLANINGMIYGDSPQQGFARGDSFYHPQMGFMFTVPAGYTIKNTPKQIVASRSGGAIIVVDKAASQSGDPSSYIVSEWLKGAKAVTPERININGHEAATASFDANLNGTPATIRIVAIKWKGNDMFRMQFAIPQNIAASVTEDLKRTTYSFREMSSSEIASIKPQRIEVVSGNEVGQVTDLFRALNNLKPGESVSPVRKYKIVR